MRKVSYMKLKGSQNLRQRLLLSPLASIPILIDDICVDATWLGLLPHEVSFLRLLETISDDCHVEINETGNPRSEERRIWSTSTDLVVHRSSGVAGGVWVAWCVIKQSEKTEGAVALGSLETTSKHL
ncbi:unnamed protein product [Lactuca virosa]|uniref:RNA 3'-terminal phosphate cyclase domain-containing protein n=1 Tax=Lactuca virosa TaxID=75947 RepID=A0AAU9NPV4_9ASTR|nr:unnamed protein product [Lactuca virosa]